MGPHGPHMGPHGAPGARIILIRLAPFKRPLLIASDPCLKAAGYPGASPWPPQAPGPPGRLGMIYRRGNLMSKYHKNVFFFYRVFSLVWGGVEVGFGISVKNHADP